MSHIEKLLASCERTRFNLTKFYRPAFDGEGGDPPAGEGDPAGGDTGDKIEVKVVTDPKTGIKQFILPDGTKAITQEHMNVEVGKARSGKENLVKELQTLRDRTSTSEAVKTELEAQIQAIKESTMTEAEKLKASAKNWEAKYNADTKKLAEERDHAFKLFSEKVISTEILAASSEHKAVSPEVMLQLVGTRAQVRDVIDPDTGKATGMKEVVVPFEDKDEEGKTIQKNASVTDYFKWMKAQPANRFGNLFLSDQAGGTGKNTRMDDVQTGANGLPDFDKMSMSEYVKWMDAHPEMSATKVK